MKAHAVLINFSYWPTKTKIHWVASPDDDFKSQGLGHESSTEWNIILLAVDKNYRARSKIAFLLVSFYISIQMPQSAVSMYMLHWSTVMMLDILNKTRQGVIEGRLKATWWFWICMYGAAVAASAVPVSSQEVQEKGRFTRDFAEKLRWICDMLGIASWEDAAETLWEVRWEHGFEGEEDLRRIWEEAVLGMGQG